MRFAVLCALPVGLCGCGTATPPDTDRINYDANTRTLTLYDLPGNDRWMVQMPGEGSGQPVTARHRLPADVEPADVRVYYSRPGVKSSAPVTVKQILDSGNAHSSLALR